MHQTTAQSLKDDILDLSRQARIAPLTHWFDAALSRQIEHMFLPVEKLERVGSSIIDDLRAYREQCGTHTIVLGMSGGVDSALSAALFKEAGWRVVGLTLPIHQAPEETQRGVEACEAIGIEHRHKDLTDLYYTTLTEMSPLDAALDGPEVKDSIRRGNVRARLRMITLYNLASSLGGAVASTDNFSELCAGFWTLHGDVGDIAPIQSLLKSWEVPALSRMYGVPEATWRATPTDGLATVAGGDEAQLGCSYLEWDLMANVMLNAMDWHLIQDRADMYLRVGLGFGQHEDEVFDRVYTRMSKTWFKRKNPVMLRHRFFSRLDGLKKLDTRLFQPFAAR